MRPTRRSLRESGAENSSDSAAAGHSTNCQQYASKLPNSSCTTRNARAFFTAAAIFIRFRMIPGSAVSLSIRACGVSRHLLRIELAECAAVALALLEHDRPAESRLRGFENEEFEMCAVIVGRHTPFPIVILAHQRIVDVDPGTPFRLHDRHAPAGPHFFAAEAAAANAANSSRPNAVPAMPQPPSAASVSSTHVRRACDGSPQMSARTAVTSVTSCF